MSGWRFIWSHDTFSTWVFDVFERKISIRKQFVSKSFLFNQFIECKLRTHWVHDALCWKYVYSFRCCWPTDKNKYQRSFYSGIRYISNEDIQEIHDQSNGLMKYYLYIHFAIKISLHHNDEKSNCYEFFRQSIKFLFYLYSASIDCLKFYNLISLKFNTDRYIFTNQFRRIFFSIVYNMYYSIQNENHIAILWHK